MMMKTKEEGERSRKGQCVDEEGERGREEGGGQERKEGVSSPYKSLDPSWSLRKIRMKGWRVEHIKKKEPGR
jgi:hypothetical protein